MLIRNGLRVAAVALFGYVGLAAMLYFSQHGMVYQPSVGARSISATPADRNLTFEDVWLTTEDGERLHGWFVPAAANPRNRTVLFFHGNAGNISHRLDVIATWHGLGLNILLIDYRGYGQSSGSPSEQGTYLDSRAAWNYLTRERSLNANQIIIVGRSLGGGIASELASQVNPRGLILESTFTSIPDLGEQLYWWLPVRQLAKVKYNTRDHLAQIDCPVLIVHSPDDEIIPFDHAPALLAAAKGPASLLQIGGSHNGGFRTSSAIYREGLDEFLGFVF